MLGIFVDGVSSAAAQVKPLCRWHRKGHMDRRRAGKTKPVYLSSCNRGVEEGNEMDNVDVGQWLLLGGGMDATGGTKGCV